MRFIIYGAGGVGGVIGAQLFKGGEQVVLIARGDHLSVLQAQGLRYQTPFEDEQLPIPTVGHPAELQRQPDDVVVMTMKSQHTRAALEELRDVYGDGVPVVCCQNGVSNEREALRRFRAVYAMLVYLPAQMLAPGCIQCHSTLKSGVLDLGLYPDGADDRCAEIAGRLDAVNLSAKPDGKIMRFKYEKLLTNLNNALDAVAPKGDLAAEIRAQLLAEGRSCYAAAGIDCASDEEVKARREGMFATGDIPGVPRAGGSSRQSLMRGTGDIEADYLNGEIVQLGRLHGVATPANAVLQRLAVEAARVRAEPGAMALEDIRAQIDRFSST